MQFFTDFQPAPSQASHFDISVLEGYFGSKFSPTSIKDIEARLLQQGNGATGIVYGYRFTEPVGHVFNAVNQNGIIRFLDGQIGSTANTSYWTRFQFTPLKPIGQ